MLNLKKIWLSLLGIIVVFWFNFQFVHWLPTRDSPKSSYWQGDERPTNPAIAETWIDDANPTKQWIKLMWDKTLWILHLPKANNYETELWYLLALIKIAVNWILWILAFVVLIYLLYCGFQVLSAWEDDKGVSAWIKWIKKAAITIAGIWLAWLIISAMIWFILLVAE